MKQKLASLPNPTNTQNPNENTRTNTFNETALPSGTRFFFASSCLFRLAEIIYNGNWGVVVSKTQRMPLLDIVFKKKAI